MLKYVTSENINRESWNTLVKTAQNSSVYCFDWYLDAFCRWDAIILDNYSGAIALPRKKKGLFTLLYQPPFVQQCQWFGEEVDTKKLFALICQHFSKIHFNCNIRFLANTKNRVNLVLPLSDYTTIHNRYSKSLKKNIRKADKNGLKLKSDLSAIDTTIKLYIAAYGVLNPQLVEATYLSLKNLVLDNNRSKHFNHFTVWKDNCPVAGLLILKSKNRLHYILGAPSTEGRELNALSFALDKIIERYCGDGMTLDFEGSSIPNVRTFYESFGATNEEFYETEYIPSTPLRWAASAYSRLFKS